tara:strand:+ start:1780 stop:4197 length:2418 start_codon:yes stop_codon:yes gene_type:complete
MANDDLRYLIKFDTDDADLISANRNAKLLQREIDKLKKELNALGSAQSKSTAFTKGQTAAMKQYQAQIKRLETALRSGGDAINQQANALVQAKNKMNKFGMVSQQVGYQVGDFFVQVQSGTSALVAFGQQGTQLAGLLPGVTGAIVGISLAVGTMLARSFMEASKAAETSASSFKNFQKSVKETRDDTKELKASLDAVKAGFESTEEYQLTQAILASKERIKDLEDKIGKLMIVNNSTSAAMVKGFQKRIEAEKEAVEDTKERLRLLSRSSQELKTQQELAEEALEEKRELLIVHGEMLLELRQETALLRIQNTVGKDSAEYSQKKRDIEKDNFQYQILSLGLSEDQVIELEDQFEVLQEQQAILDEMNRDKDSLIKAAKDELQIEKLKLTSLQGYNSEGEKTQDILDAEVALAAEIVRKKWEQKFALNGISQEEQKLIDALVEQAELQERAEQSIKKAKDDAREFAKEMASAARASEKLANFLGKSDDKLPALRAKLAVLRAGGSRGEADIAGAAAGARSAVTEAYGGSLAGAPPSVIGEADKYVANKAEEARLQAEINELLKTKKELTNIKDDIRDAEEKLKLDRASVFATREEVGYLTTLKSLRDANKDADIKMSDQRLQETAKRLAQYQEETKHLEDLRDLTTDWAQSFGDAIVSVVDGTEKAKDAFNNLALAIVKDLYDIFVVKQITGFVTGTVGSTWSDLGKVGAPSLDGGGYTGNGPRSGGLDGKGGFMAMLHPRETIVDHTKGGSSGVVVNQTINVSTGVQQTVRAEVMGLMPQIAAASKGAVLDAKRRGGAYAGAF